jgi:PIN domain nuclease of toxin-antitoxin system
MKLLLDTHIWIWSVLDPGKLSRRVTTALQKDTTAIWLSPVSVWELGILSGRGRIVLSMDLEQWVEKAFKAAPLREAPLTNVVALAAFRIQLPHRDTADAFLAATASVFNLTLVTADARPLAAGHVPTLANL